MPPSGNRLVNFTSVGNLIGCEPKFTGWREGFMKVPGLDPGKLDMKELML